MVEQKKKVQWNDMLDNMNDYMREILGLKRVKIDEINKKIWENDLYRYKERVKSILGFGQWFYCLGGFEHMMKEEEYERRKNDDILMSQIQEICSMCVVQ